MIFRAATYLPFFALFFSVAFPSEAAFAQRPAPAPKPGAGSRSSPGLSPPEGGDATVDMDIYVRGADGGPIEVTAVVTLVATTGQVLSQGTTLNGNIQFKGVGATEYKIQVAAPGYENTVKEFDGYNAGKSRVEILMRPASSGEKGAGPLQMLLAPKAQKELAKALEALRANKPEAARSHLEEAYRRAPNHPAVTYLYGVYFFQMKEEERAKFCWEKTIEFDPKHVSALLSLSEAMMREQKIPDAESYVKRAVEADPKSWRAHAILANVYLREGSPQEAIKEADRALGLGHEQAAIVQPMLAQALDISGSKERAIRVLQEYVQAHPSDGAAGKQLESMISAKKEEAAIEARPPAETEAERAISVPLPSKGHPEEKKAANEAEFSSMDPKSREEAQEALDKAFRLLSANRKVWAKKDLERAYKIVPASPDVNYLLGVYWWQKDDRPQAMSYWRKAVGFNPKHFRALLSIGQALVDESKPDQALPYLERATQAEPFSWRSHALEAHVYLRQGSADQAAKEAQRAIELGREEAAVAQKYLSAALAERGDKDEAVSVLEGYIRNHRGDLDAKKQLDKLSGRGGPNAPDTAKASGEELLQSGAIAAVTPVPLTASRWFPPDVDENVPLVEAGVACDVLEGVVRKAGKRVEEFVGNVDRFTANELLEHDSIDKGGFAQSEETRKFDYVASIDQYKPGYFSVTEYRTGVQSSSQFPDGVETRGLSALALIFHPNNAENFEMSCEGLSQWEGRQAWQVHFRQRADKPNTIRAYKFGESGLSYAVALKGRAWIATDSYQILHMETDLVATLPEIRLFADHTVVEYGPVRFKNRSVELWLPQSADLYCDWKGKRMHRRLSYSNYLLFSVDEKQKIAKPKQETESQPQN